MSINVVTERLGHAHPASTIHTYEHLLPGMGAAMHISWTRQRRQRARLIRASVC
jgi:hypothetical protein